MDRIVRQKVDDTGKDEVENVPIHEVDWTKFLDDKVTQLFSCLNNRDRASLSSTCKAWWMLSKSTFLWKTLDLRSTNIDGDGATSLASRCGDLQKLRMRGNRSASYIVNLKANNLREIYIDMCTLLTDATLTVFLAHHVALECIRIEPDIFQRITSVGIKAIANWCLNLKTLWLRGVNEINGEAINDLAHKCRNLTDIGFIDCRKIDEVALGNVTTLRFLSVSGSNIDWDLATLHWNKILNLTCLDVSRTNIDPRAVSRLLASCCSLELVCALSCPLVDKDSTSVSRRGKVVVRFFNDILKEVSCLFVDMPKENGNVFLGGRFSNNFKDRKLKGVLDWLEYVICDSLLSVSYDYTPAHDDFWLQQGTSLLCSFLQSPHVEVQEKATTALATFVVPEDVNLIDFERTEAIIREDGIHLLVNLARSWQEVLQSEAIKALLYLSVDGNIAKAVIDEGGVDILIYNAKSANKALATDAVGGLSNLAVYSGNKSAIAKADGVRTLVEVIVRWSQANDGEGVLKVAASALASLASDDKCSAEIVSVGGILALEPLLGTGMAQSVQEQAARCLASMASHDDSNENLVAVRLETGILEALVQLVRSPSDDVRLAATMALCNLSSEKRNRDEIAAVGGVQALVALAKSCGNSSHDLQATAAKALWGMTNSEENIIAIVDEGGVAPLIALAKSDSEDVHEMAATTLWTLTSDARHVKRIIEEDGVATLTHLCSSSVSKLARFTSALTLAYMFDKGLDEIAMVGTSSGSTSKSSVLISTRRVALKAIDIFLKSCYDPPALSNVASSLSPAPAALERVTELTRNEEAVILSCRGSDFERLLAMLSHHSPIIKSFCAFALFQFTIPGGEYALNHAALLQNAGARRLLRVTAASVRVPIEAKAFAPVVLRNLEHHQVQ